MGLFQAQYESAAAASLPALSSPCDSPARLQLSAQAPFPGVTPPCPAPLQQSPQQPAVGPLSELNPTLFILSFPGGSEGKASACKVRDQVRSLDREDSLE